MAGEHDEDGDRLMTLAIFHGESTEPIEECALPSEQGRVEDPTAPFREWTARHPSWDRRHDHRTGGSWRAPPRSSRPVPVTAASRT